MTRSREPCVRTWGQRPSIRRGQGAETNVNTQFSSFHANTRLEKTFREAIHPVSPLHFTNKRRGPLSDPQVTWSNSCTRVPGPDCWRQSKPCIQVGVRRTTESRSPCRARGGRPSAYGGGAKGGEHRTTVESRAGR